MKKVVRLTESDLTKIVKRVIKENEEEFDSEIGKPEFTVEPHVKMQPREKEIESLFGKYDEQIPADILRYMRKNPQLIMNRLAKVYGSKFLDYAEKAYIKYGRYDY
jgi:hypothetical protein